MGKNYTDVNLEAKYFIERFEEQKKEIKELKSLQKIDKETLKDMTTEVVMVQKALVVARNLNIELKRQLELRTKKGFTKRKVKSFWDR